MFCKISTSISFMFRERPLLERFAAAGAAGFDGVEIQLLEEGAPAAMAEASRRALMPVTLINVPMGDYLSGGPGLSGVPGREAQFRMAFDQALSAARQLSATFIHLGPSRVPEGVDREICRATYRRNAEAALALAERAQVRLLLEPMNRVDAPTALFADLDEAADLLRLEFDGRIGLLFDLYHLAMTGQDLARAAARHCDLIGHVQFSDAPGRHEPGSGRIDFGAAFAALEAAGYKGWFGAEYFPRGPTAETLSWLPALRRGPAGVPAAGSG